MSKLVSRVKRSARLISRKISSPPLALLLPGLGWFVWFLLVPLAIVVVYSFATKGIYGGVVYEFSGENYLRAADWIYLRVFSNSLWLAALTAVSCLVIGYPMAYVMATSGPRLRSILLTLVVVPFWTNFVVRAYAIKVLFGEQGPLNQLALQWGWIQEPFGFANTDFAVWLGMVTNYLPFMVLPLFVAIDKFDFGLMEAARDLGAGPFHVFWRILVPLTKQGIVSGLIFVFTPALGEFVIPDLLGGARTMLIGNLITEQFLKTRDWPFGAALSLLLILVVTLCLVVYLKSEARDHAEVM